MKLVIDGVSPTGRPKELELESNPARGLVSIWIKGSGGWCIILRQDQLPNGFAAGRFEGCSAGKDKTGQMWGDVAAEPRLMTVTKAGESFQIRVHHPSTSAGSVILVDAALLQDAFQRLTVNGRRSPEKPRPQTAASVPPASSVGKVKRDVTAQMGSPPRPVSSTGNAAATTVTDWVGTTLSGRYGVIATLGEGGMGVVYRAWDDNVGQDVVVKVPRRAMMVEPGFAARFKDEIRSLIKLSHPHIVKLFDVGEHDGLPFAVMQFLPGGSLADRATDRGGNPRPLPPSILKGWLPQVAKALQFMHGQNYVHRDVKPANILFDTEGNAYLSDFGVNKALDNGDATARAQTGTGMVLGTPHYMAPELAQGAEVDGRIDQYALAVTVHEVLSGQKPFDGPTGLAIMFKHVNEPPPSLDTVVPGIPPALAEAVLRALEKNPENRFKTCTAFAAAVLTAVTGGAQTPPTSGTTASASFPTSATYSLAPDSTASKANPPAPVPKIATAAMAIPTPARSAITDGAPSVHAREQSHAALNWLKSPPGIIASVASSVVVIGLLAIAVFSSSRRPSERPSDALAPGGLAAPLLEGTYQSSEATVDAPQQSDHRSRWINETYHTVVRFVAGKKVWEEVDSKSGKVKWVDREVSRTADYVDVYSPERMQEIRLRADKMELKKDGRWGWVADGRWAEQGTATTADATKGPPTNETADIRLAASWQKGAPTLAFESPVPLTVGGIPIDLGSHAAPRLADWNDDGALDLLVAGGDGGLWLFRQGNHANGTDFLRGERLQANGTPIKVGTAATGACFADIDGDGMPDLVAAGNDRRIRYYANRGARSAPSFKSFKVIPGTGGDLVFSEDIGGRFDIIDWDLDGLLDLLTGGHDGYITLYRNIGTSNLPKFDTSGVRLSVRGSTLHEAYNVHPRVFDINQDGKPDVTFGINWGSIKVLLNTKSAGQTDFTTEIAGCGGQRVEHPRADSR